MTPAGGIVSIFAVVVVVVAASWAAEWLLGGNGWLMRQARKRKRKR